MMMRFAPHKKTGSLLENSANMEVAKDALDEPEAKVAMGHKPASAASRPDAAAKAKASASSFSAKPRPKRPASGATPHPEPPAPEEQALMVAERPRPAQADSSAKTRVPAPGNVDFGYVIPEVMALMPPVSGIKLGRESKWHTRWRVTYPGEPARTISATFGPNRKEAETVSTICQWAWGLYSQSNPSVPCPWDWSTLV